MIVAPVNRSSYFIYPKPLKKNEISFKSKCPTGLFGGSVYIPPKGIIKPRCLGLAHYFDSAYSINTEYYYKAKNAIIPDILDRRCLRFFDYVLPKEIQECREPIKESLHLSAFDKLNGSLGAFSEFDGKVISTDRLFECAALAIVDTKQKLQSLIHCYAWENKSDLKVMLNYITKHSNQKDLEFFFVPGCKKETANTLLAMDDILKKSCPQAKFNYMNYPYGYKQFANTAVILQNGELKFCNTNLIQDKRINPINEILYFDWHSLF